MDGAKTMRAMAQVPRSIFAASCHRSSNHANSPCPSCDRRRRRHISTCPSSAITAALRRHKSFTAVGPIRGIPTLGTTARRCFPCSCHIGWQRPTCGWCQRHDRNIFVRFYEAKPGPTRVHGVSDCGTQVGLTDTSVAAGPIAARAGSNSRLGRLQLRGESTQASARPSSHECLATQPRGGVEPSLRSERREPRGRRAVTSTGSEWKRPNGMHVRHGSIPLKSSIS